MDWTLYLSGLEKSMSDHELRDLCASYGAVESAHVVTDDSTDQATGLGIVRMGLPEDVGKAVIALKDAELAGYRVEAYFMPSQEIQRLVFSHAECIQPPSDMHDGTERRARCLRKSTR